jgi:hypothetical protein
VVRRQEGPRQGSKESGKRPQENTDGQRCKTALGQEQKKGYAAFGKDAWASYFQVRKALLRKTGKPQRYIPGQIALKKPNILGFSYWAGVSRPPALALLKLLI